MTVLKPCVLFITHDNLSWLYSQTAVINILRPRQNGRSFPDDIFKCIFLNEINNIQALVQIMAWRRQGDKPLSEPMMVTLPTHICVTRPQWVNSHMRYMLLLWVKNGICVFFVAGVSTVRPSLGFIGSRYIDYIFHLSKKLFSLIHCTVGWFGVLWNPTIFYT